jgi:hypothetical protein
MKLFLGLVTIGLIQSVSTAGMAAEDEPIQPAAEIKADDEKESNLEGTSLTYIIPESAPLPKSVIRFRAVYNNASSETSYDGSGKEDPLTEGFELSAQGFAADLEMGVTERLSAQVLVPFSLGGETKLVNEGEFRSRADVKAQVESAIDGSLATLLNNIKSNFGAGWDANVPAPSNILNPLTGDVLIPAGTPVQTGYNALREKALGAGLDQAVAAARKAGNRKLAEGIGDIEIGARYSLSTVSDPWFKDLPLYTSVAAGFRLNTSGYSKATEEGKLPVGRGTTDLDIRANADYEPIRGLQLQVENQSEFMVMSGKAYTAAKSDGGQEKTLKRDGIRQNGYAKLAVGTGAWIDSTKFLILSTRFNWDNDPATKIGSQKSELKVKRSMQYGVSLDGLNYGMPIQLDYDYIMALASPNTQFAVDAHQVQLKLYCKF